MHLWRSIVGHGMEEGKLAESGALTATRDRWQLGAMGEKEGGYVTGEGL